MISINIYLSISEKSGKVKEVRLVRKPDGKSKGMDSLINLYIFFDFHKENRFDNFFSKSL